MEEIKALPENLDQENFEELFNIVREFIAKHNLTCDEAESVMWHLDNQFKKHIRKQKFV